MHYYYCDEKVYIYGDTYGDIYIDIYLKNNHELYV